MRFNLKVSNQIFVGWTIQHIEVIHETLSFIVTSDITSMVC